MSCLKPIGWTSRRAEASLLLVALIWGSGFIATERALRSGLSPALIMAVRFWIAALGMLPFHWRKLRAASRRSLQTGGVAGVLLCGAFFAQTYGQAGTTVSNSAFLTATNVVMVPFVVWGFTRKRPALRVYLLALGTLAGIGVLTLRPGGGLIAGRGDGMVLLSALLYALHIAYLGTAALEQDAGLLALLQMLVSALLSTVTLLCFEAEAAGAASVVGTSWISYLPPLLYLGLFPTCLCFFLQTAAQQKTSASAAAILLSTEGLFGSVFSVLLGLEPWTWRLALGGAMILACTVLTQVDYTCSVRLMISSCKARLRLRK